jgi:hypothetical protein
LTLKVEVPPASVVTNPVIGLTVIPGRSSLIIVVVAVAVPIVELPLGRPPFGNVTGFERVRIIVSSGSTLPSPKTSRVTVFDVSPEAKLIRPVVLVAPEVPPILL